MDTINKQIKPIPQLFKFEDTYPLTTGSPKSEGCKTQSLGCKQRNKRTQTQKTQVKAAGEVTPCLPF
jgi:hypothetical protein